MFADEAFDAAEQKADAALAVGKQEAPGRQTLAPPALNRLAGDVELLRGIIDRQHRLRELLRVQVERFADLLDQQAKIMLKGEPREQVRRRGLRAITRD